MKKPLIFLLLLVFVLAAAGLAQASTSADKQLAIDKGLAYLASTQKSNGSWAYGGYEQAATGAVLLAFTEQKYKPLGWNGPDYSTVVSKATNYLLSQAVTLPFAAAGNWWGFGAGSSGIQMAAANNENTYTTGLAVPALSRLVRNPYGGAPIYTPGTVISGTGNAVVDGKTYTQVIQGMVDSFTYYQTGPGTNKYGGWRYYAGPQDSDMSTTQWAPISYLFAAQVPGVTIPNGSVKTALRAWLGQVQEPGGGVDYYPVTEIGIYGIGANATHAGGFLISNFFAGGGGLGGDGKAQALAWLNANWLSGPSGTWYGNEGHPYAMWAVYKALETLYGTTGAGPISNLHPQTTLLDSGATWNWWEDYCQWLVQNQNGTGSWNGYDYWTDPLSTAWDINILNATRTVIPTPLPGTLLLLGSGLLGMGVLRKRMKK